MGVGDKNQKISSFILREIEKHENGILRFFIYVIT